ncbi:MAG: cation transporter, partial [Nitrosomonadaceae bacterium]
MSSPTLKQIELPITGMTCSACAARIEKNLNKLPGVHAAVNFANEKVRIEIDSGTTTQTEDLIHSIEQSGFHVAPQSIHLKISDMTCAACSNRIERTLNKIPSVTATV